MRITTNYIYSMSENSISGGYQRIAKLQQEITSGIRVSQAEIDPVGMAAITRLQGKLDGIQQGAKNATQAKTELQTEQTQLNSYGKILQNFRDVVNKAANGSNNSDDLKGYGREIEQYLEQLASVANTKNQDGKSIFAGTKTSGDAYEITKDSEGNITGMKYQGDDSQQKINLESGVTVNIYQSGDNIFGKGKDSVFQNMVDFAKRLETGKALTETETSDELKKITGFQDTNTTNTSGVTNDYKLADFEVNLHNSLSSNYVGMLSNLRDADYTTTVSELSKQMTLLQASMAASTQLEKLSIFNQV